MARFQHEVTGVVVVVDEATAATLGPEFKRLDESKKSQPARRAASAKK